VKKFFMILLAVLLCCGLFACGDKDKEKEGGPVIDTTPEVWQEVRGNFAREGSSQYNNATLQMMYLGNGCVMFEFNLMEGSESEDWAWDIVLPFVALIDDDGVGQYESDPEAENPLKITLKLSDDGQTVTASHTGEMPISCDGMYEFMSDGLEVSEVSAAAILDHLPTAATSLNHNNGAYTMVYSDEVVFNWFYPVTATFDDTDAALAKFIIAKDLSAVYRVDDDIDPVLIFGSAQPMIDYESYVYPDADEETDEGTDGEPIAVPLVDVISEAGLTLEPGGTSKLTAVLPWAFDYAIEAESSDTSIVTVSGAEIKATAAGMATISGTLTVDDGNKEFEFEISVGGEGEAIEAEPEPEEEAVG
jgi:hypothetical protein